MDGTSAGGRYEEDRALRAAGGIGLHHQQGRCPPSKLFGPTQRQGELGYRWCADTGVAIAVAPVGEAIIGTSHSERIDNVR